MLSIIDCPCSNPLPHKKFQVEIDGQTYFTDGFFTIAEGRLMLLGLLETGFITNEDIENIEQVLISCGLKKTEEHSENNLQEFANVLALNTTVEEQEVLLGPMLQSGFLSEEEAEQIREFIRQAREEVLKSKMPPNS